MIYVLASLVATIVFLYFKLRAIHAEKTVLKDQLRQAGVVVDHQLKQDVMLEEVVKQQAAAEVEYKKVTPPNEVRDFETNW